MTDMSLIVLYLMVSLIGFSVIAIFWKPSFALPLLISSFSLEQLLYRFIPFFNTNIEFYNYFIGAVCILALLAGVYRYGLPSLSAKITLTFAVLLFLAWVSSFWTPAPNAANSALLHFSLEGTLSILLPLFTIRSRDDFRIIMWVTAIFAVIVSYYIILDPVEGLGARSTLAEGGTVLSPGLLVGTAIIFMAAFEHKDDRRAEYIALPIILIFLITLTFLGTRGQLAFAFIMAVIIYAMKYRGYEKKIFSTGAIILLVSFLILQIFPNIGEQIFNNYAASENTAREEHFSSEGVEAGFQARVDMLASTITFDKPVFGHGVMGWAYHDTGHDLYHYPHNSLAQVYFELGLVGLSLFLALIYFAARQGYQVLVSPKFSTEQKQLMITLLCYLAFSFIISLKQETFMSCLGVYMSVAMITIARDVIFTQRRRRRRKRPLRRSLRLKV